MRDDRRHRTGLIVQPWALGKTPRRVENAAQALAAELDPQAAVRRAAKAAGDRRVTIRPTPDTMTYLTSLFPVAQGVAAWASLRAAARAEKAAGDERTESQIMADLFVQRITGQATATAVPTEIQLVMTPDTLLGTSDRPARIGDAVIPAHTARDLAARTDAPRWLRRLFTDPATGLVTTIDPRRRRFTPADSRFLGIRDQHCRHPRCDGAITDHDHVIRPAEGGPATRTNGQGLCEAHNLVKETPGWTTRVADPRPGHHTVETTTPTGHTYRSQAPPGSRPRCNWVCPFRVSEPAIPTHPHAGVDAHAPGAAGAAAARGAAGALSPLRRQSAHSSSLRYMVSEALERTPDRAMTYDWPCGREYAGEAAAAIASSADGCHGGRFASRWPTTGQSHHPQSSRPRSLASRRRRASVTSVRGVRPPDRGPSATHLPSHDVRRRLRKGVLAGCARSGLVCYDPLEELCPS